MSVRPSGRNLDAAFECKKISSHTFLNKVVSYIGGTALITGIALHAHKLLMISLIGGGFIALTGRSLVNTRLKMNKKSIMKTINIKPTEAIECNGMKEAMDVIRLSLFHSGKEQRHYMRKALSLNYKK